MSDFKEHKITGKSWGIWNSGFFFFLQNFSVLSVINSFMCGSLQCQKLLKSSLSISNTRSNNSTSLPNDHYTQQACSIGAVGPTPSPGFQFHYATSHILHTTAIAATDICCLKLGPSA